MTSEKHGGALQTATQPLLLAILLIPLLPALATPAIAMTAKLFGCSIVGGVNCDVAGVDVSAAYISAANLLHRTAAASTGGMLLVCLAAVTVLAPMTIKGFRGRVVRTFAAVLAVAVTPFVLNAASAHASRSACGSHLAADAIACPPTDLLHGIVFYGTAFSGWLADIAVPLAVLATLFLALSFGYRHLAARLACVIASRS